MKKLLLSLLLFSLCTSQSVCALDWFTFGARVGTPLGDSIEEFRSPAAELTPSQTNFLIGPSAELLLPFGLGFEVDALYKRTEVELETPSDVTSDTVSSWEFPLMAKYRFPGPNLKPFVGAGVAFRSFSNLSQFARGLDSTVNGYVFGGGLLIKVGGVRLSPELRYTRWNSIDPGETTPVRNSKNQTDFMVGITF